MYERFIKSIPKLKLENGSFKTIHINTTVGDTKPFVLCKCDELEDTFLSFIYGDDVYLTPFRLHVDGGTFQRLRTVITLLDQSTKEINIAEAFTRNGIPITKLSFVKNRIELEEISITRISHRNPILTNRLLALFKDIRDVLYI